MGHPGRASSEERPGLRRRLSATKNALNRLLNRLEIRFSPIGADPRRRVLRQRMRVKDVPIQEPLHVANLERQKGPVHQLGVSAERGRPVKADEVVEYGTPVQPRWVSHRMHLAPVDRGPRVGWKRFKSDRRVARVYRDRPRPASVHAVPFDQVDLCGKSVRVAPVVGVVEGDVLAVGALKQRVVDLVGTSIRGASQKGYRWKRRDEVRIDIAAGIVNDV